LPPDQLLLQFLILFGWIPFALMFVWMGKILWIKYLNIQWMSEIKFTLLAIDIPRANELSPKAVESIFTYIGGAYSSPDLIDTYWIGKVQLSFSFEIVSLEGYTQFLVRMPEQYRNLVESAVYSQYPDAEITEVNDYTEGFPTRFPDEEYDVFGTEWLLKENQVYPIKSYVEFEHQAPKGEIQFNDPMASLMDLCSSLGRGENLWFQIIVIPTNFDWTEEGDKEVAKILGEKKGGKNIADVIIDGLMNFLSEAGEMIFSIWGDIESGKDDKKEATKMIDLKPKQKKQVEMIQEKCSKLGFLIKMRHVYMAKKEMMNKPKVANGFAGYMKQFAVLDLNSFKSDGDKTATSVSYLMQESRLNKRKNSIVRNYINREDWAGRKPYILNIEELATLWHFPVESAVKAPMIQKAPGRKAEAPMSLPIGEEIVSEDILEPIFEDVKPNSKTNNTKKVSDNNFEIEDSDKQKIIKKEPPSNLPIG
jgi:hypothetical protein